MLDYGQNLELHGSRLVQAKNYYENTELHENHYHDNATGAFDPMKLLLEHTMSDACNGSSEHYDQPKCHPETRVAVLRRINDWAKDTDEQDKPIMWLYGPAGAGKSAIAQTLAERWREGGCLAALYFFSRNHGQQNTKTSLVATIAYQLSQSFPEIRTHLAKAVSTAPIILKQSLEAQIKELIIAPLLATYQEAGAGPDIKIIVIDGLDECDGEDTQGEILRLFAAALCKYKLPLVLLVCSRPERQIRAVFSEQQIDQATTRLVLDYKLGPNADIELFLRCKFKEVRHVHGRIKESWPTEEDIMALVERSSGQFIYASTVVKYLLTRGGKPTTRLKIILGLKSPGKDTPFAALDALYTHILSTVAEGSRQVVANVFRILILDSGASPFFGIEEKSPAYCGALLGSDGSQIDHHLQDLHSLLEIPTADQSACSPINFYHASFPDFLRNHTRSRDHHIEDSLAHADMARWTFRHLSLQSGAQPGLAVNTAVLQAKFLHHIGLAAANTELRAGLEVAFGFGEESSAGHFEESEPADAVHGSGPSLFNDPSSKLARVEVLRYLQKCNWDLESTLSWKRLRTGWNLLKAVWRTKAEY